MKRRLAAILAADAVGFVLDDKAAAIVPPSARSAGIGDNG